MGAGNASGRFLGPLIILSAMTASIPIGVGSCWRAAVLHLAEADHRRCHPWRHDFRLVVPGRPLIPAGALAPALSGEPHV